MGNALLEGALKVLHVIWNCKETSFFFRFFFRVAANFVQLENLLYSEWGVTGRVELKKKVKKKFKEKIKVQEYGIVGRIYLKDLQVCGIVKRDAAVCSCERLHITAYFLGDRCALIQSFRRAAMQQ